MPDSKSPPQQGTKLYTPPSDYILATASGSPNVTK
ncbi:hypothetical protein XF_1184 [Xylella fastidiosa 9a5c]|uniref:Uncharacterized protein n=1 Tax=Xylella fastidiosa (strain 9a5c) TaxID=160492 RepID=Q9PE44_XYLFA|nr:hypothetical protein XF_1184 [Xylella fastidiosa 9a5c]